jgi:hypothetical protein
MAKLAAAMGFTFSILTFDVMMMMCDDGLFDVRSYRCLGCRMGVLISLAHNL